MNNTKTTLANVTAKRNTNVVTMVDKVGAELFRKQAIAFMGNGEVNRADIERELKDSITFYNGGFLIAA